MPGTHDNQGASPVARHIECFTDVIGEAIDVRVCHGVHCRASAVRGAGIGRNVARRLDTHDFRPVR